eukprot:1961564-Prymnesium_polylepis.1
MSAASHCRAAVRLSAADPEFERLNNVGFDTLTAASERGTGWQTALALRWRSECMHSSPVAME